MKLSIKRVISFLTILFFFFATYACNGVSTTTPDTSLTTPVTTFSGTTISGQTTQPSSGNDPLTTITTLYGPDDKIPVEVLLNGWNNIAVSSEYAENPYKLYIDNTYGLDFTMTNTVDLETELAKRYASASAKKPDVIVFFEDDFYTMKALYNQGFFVEDYTEYLADVPVWANNMALGTNPYYKFSENGKLIALAMPPAEAFSWCFKIRKDWVESYSPTGENPVTVTELLQMAENVKTNLGEGYYLFTAAGENKGFGNMENFQFMFGDHNDFYVNDDGDVDHPLFDGSRKKYLDFMKTLVDNDYVDPNFYIQAWGAKRGMLVTGKAGIDWYTANIETEYLWANGNDEVNYSGHWVNLEIPSDTVGVTRKSGAMESFSRFFVISSEAAEDPEKMERILTFLNDMAYPSDSYYRIRWGYDIDSYEIGEGKDVELVMDPETEEWTGFYAYFDQRKAHLKHVNGGLWDYGVMNFTREDKVIEYLTAQSYTTSAYEFIHLYSEAIEYNIANKADSIGQILNLNARLYTTLNDYQDEFEISYIRGTNTISYDQFVDNWLGYGGSTILQAVESQFQTAGYMD
jgi:putative aldouronate transport system substrate-binding protein